jgi:cellulose synthase/poly-beta-1,6-N-acetylglucosamine synthase-like glycosyltransferase
MWFIFGAFFIIYFVIIFGITITVYFKRQTNTVKNYKSVRLSIVVACRNEENNILNLLNALKFQFKPEYIKSIEIIIVDDHSEDKTRALIEKFEGLPALRVLDPGEAYGKKAALQVGIRAAEGDFILMTDADCIPDERWVNSMTSCFFSADNCEMVLGGVIPLKGNSFISKMQFAELAVLMGVTQGSAMAGFPLLCNGANLLVSQKAWEAVQKDTRDANYISGDDMFLMEKIVKRYGNHSVRFCDDSPGSIVLTGYVDSIKDFFTQRFRWVSKSPGYRSIPVILIALIVFSINLCIVLSFATALFSAKFLEVSVFLVLGKVITDFLLVDYSLRKAGQRNLLWLFIPLEIVGPFYIVITAVLGVLLNTSWKGRRVFGKGFSN